jgi:ABC-type glycerol-3-phosphate transport system substrate-binding protein
MPALFVSLFLLSAAMVSAGGGQEGTASGEPLEISYYGYWMGDIVDDNYCETLIQDALDIEIIARKVNHAQKEQVDLMLASGDMPDCGWFTYAPQYMYYEQELTRTIPVDLVKKYAPSYIKTYDDFPILYHLIRTKEDPDEYYALSGHQAYFMGRQYFFCNFYRKDWLDKFGIAPSSPVEEMIEGVYATEKGFTLDQFETILAKFTNDDPDGNGKNDTTGMLGDAGFTFNWSPLLGAFDLVPDFPIEDNGKAVYYYSTERYKSFLKYVNRLFEKGYIDQEILTLDRQQFWEKAQNSYGGYFAVSANWLGTWAMQRPPLNILENVEGASVLMTPGQIGPSGAMGTRMYSATPAQGWFYIKREIEDEAKLRKILELAEFVGYSDAKLNLAFGEEGVDFDMVDGQPVRREGFIHGGARGINAYSLFIQDERYLNWINDKMFIATGKYTLGADGLWNKYLAKPYKYDLMNETQLQTLQNKYGSNINDVVKQFFAAAVMGQVDIDSEWNAYLRQLDAANYDDVRAELDKAPLYTSFFE